MLIRIVDMHFTARGRDEFLRVFNASKEKIAAFPGCLRLELLNDLNDPNHFFTYSFWDSEQSLENYRNSELFITTWKATKIHFSRKAQACSVNQLFNSKA